MDDISVPDGTKMTSIFETVEYKNCEISFRKEIFSSKSPKSYKFIFKVFHQKKQWILLIIFILEYPGKRYLKN